MENFLKVSRHSSKPKWPTSIRAEWPLTTTSLPPKQPRDPPSNHVISLPSLSPFYTWKMITGEHTEKPLFALRSSFALESSEFRVGGFRSWLPQVTVSTGSGVVFLPAYHCSYQSLREQRNRTCYGLINVRWEAWFEECNNFYNQR